MYELVKPRKLDPNRVWMDPKDCERMTRKEFEAMRLLLGVLSYVEFAQADLQERLKKIPDGAERMKAAIKGLGEVTEDLIGTMTVNQCRQVKNTMHDMEMRYAPKMSAKTVNVVLEKEIAKGLVDVAMEKCQDCVEDGVSCQRCGLYKLLEAVTPMSEYSELRCPYAITEWES